MFAMESQNINTFKVHSHRGAESKGFFTSMKHYPDGSATATPVYPGVALYTVDPTTGKKAAEALVQIIFADTNVVYSNVIVAGANKDELTINMNCLSKDSSTPMRFLLGNLSDDETRFTIADGGRSIIDLVVNPRSYSKIPGTDKGQEVILADTGLASGDAFQQGCRPISGTCYTITIGKPRAETRGYMRTFDDNAAINLHSLTPGHPFGGGGRCVRGGETVADGLQCDGDDSDDDEVADGPGGAMAPTSCVFAVTDNLVGKRNYSQVDYNSKVVFAATIYFSKTLYVAPEPAQKPAVEPPQFVVCGGSEVFFCPHNSYQLLVNPVATVDKMNCPCVNTLAAREAALNSVMMMMIKD